MSQIDTWKETIIKESKCIKVDIIPVSENKGILVEAIFHKKSNDSEEIIRKICMNIHKNLPENENAFPFKVYCFNEEDEKYTVTGFFKTSPNEYVNGSLKSFLMAGDALIFMRKIDVEALFFEVSRPFSFKFKTNQESSFKFDKNVKYKSLSFKGREFLVDSFNVCEPIDDLNSITIY